MDLAALTSSEENYLKALYSLTEWEDEPVTTGSIAIQLGVAPASATSMVSKLAGKALLVHPPYGAISFTEAGRMAALNVVRRHRLIETFLLKDLGYGWDEVHEEADRLEHTVSARFIEALAARLGNPAFDPHGDPIPGSDGSIDKPPAIRLDRFQADGAPVQARVSRISDEDPAFLRLCSELGICPGVVVSLPHTQISPLETTMLWVLPVHLNG